MKIETRLGNPNDLDELEQLYNDLCDHLEAHDNYPGWKKGVYPTRQDALEGIEENALFVATIDGKIAGTLILRHKPEEADLSVRKE
ncbi:MAG: hypothetical protein PUC65_15675 [Clostridiales bacterium]|nr:hypothetical protein [Clostridiales bacterium]